MTAQTLAQTLAQTPTPYETIVREPFAGEVRDLVRQWCEDVTDHVGTTFGDCYHSKIEEIENESRDGFIPFTEGGFEGIAYATLSAAYGSGFIPAVIQPYIDSDIKDCEAEWDRENPKHTVEWIGAGADDAPAREHWREKYYEFQDEWMNEGGTYFYKIRALFLDTDNRSNESGEPEVLFCAGINTDFEYGRDNIPWLSAYGSKTQQTEWAWERTARVSGITKELIECMVKDAIDSLAKL